ncbi:GNAT family N-acetyltransferase [Mycobacteroides immunogenum]|uniref:GNAT family acetyltransferase n=1 Tax=Mycobacteroides immunogenum TaxID=83262 RepID=A0A7V8RVJ1_9MYCO|nr:GNAT family N-acetyltransferase [Mycobacteroides immunogenum]AMT72579.1 GNAT family acetyltransferase [Mycobacteroides immunogenum]ANO05741.1 GNAT family acetyltransferase [Mycobacteroides immunogenum]KIU41101.1 GNAT family acetyltraansferase [Mycobacteroides immunogenum]KPG06007.1 GNAT family acetyltransferase [Mycobacteroides immunogenum]KPG07658.1 GNAT family acetyltransferase [Mycobacteroides immunogenum]
MDESEATVTDAPANHRFEITADGELAGFTEYLDTSLDGTAVRIFFHTEIDEKFGGRGLAGTLVRSALTTSRSTGRMIVPVCPYVRKFVGKNHEFDDILSPVTREALAAVEARQG